MAKYKITGKVTKQGLGTVKATKNIEAASESEAISKAKARWQNTYGKIINNDTEIEDIIVAVL